MRKLIKSNANLPDGNMKIILKNLLVINPSILYISQIFFSLYVLGGTAVHFCNFLLCCPSQRSAPSQVPSQVATQLEIGSQLWAGETPDLNPGLQDNSVVSNH